MKKLFAICLALVLVLSLSVSVMAASNFVNSPSNNRAPIIIDCENESEDCTATIVVTPFGDRDTLPDDQKNNFQEAYDQILNSDNLLDLFNGLESVITPGAIVDNFSVSDLFNMHFKDCDNHDLHGKFKIELSTETLKGFVGLVQFVDGKWELITDAEVEGDKYLSFTTDDLGSFAVVVDRTKAETTSPVTGAPVADYARTAVIVAVSVLFASAAAVIIIKKKHEKA